MTALPAAVRPARASPAPAVVIGHPLALADVVAVARQRVPVALAPDLRERLAAARSVVDRLAGSGQAVYGVTTGLGAAVDTRLDPADVAAFQHRAVLARAVAVGPTLPTEAVRAAIVARLAGLARGASGLSPAIADVLCAMLNRGLHPVAHGIGSLGESDLAVLAGLFLPLVGAGEAELDGELLPGRDAMVRAGIASPPLAAKDGLALVNANSVTCGAAALVLADMARAWEAATVAAALSLEGFRANLSVLDPRATALRRAPGQAECAARLASLLAGSDLWEPGRARRVQDPLSLRCVSPVHGAWRWRLDEAVAVATDELNGAGDSPAVLVEAGEMLSTVNFDTTALALSLESLGQAAAAAGTLAAARVTCLLSGDLTGLPRFLSRRGASRAGFAPVGKTAAALDAEIRHLALPVGPLVVPVADGVEDYAPSTPRIVAKLGTVVERLRLLVAVELLVAAEAVDQRGPIRLGAATAAAHAAVRRLAAPLMDDRPTGPDIRALAEAVASGVFAPEVAGGGA